MSVQVEIARRRCPHERVDQCPLYLVSHFGRGFGCDDGNLLTGECAVDRGAMDYEAEVAAGRATLWRPRA